MMNDTSCSGLRNGKMPNGDMAFYVYPHRPVFSDTGIVHGVSGEITWKILPL